MEAHIQAAQSVCDFEIEGLEIRKELGRGGMSAVYLASETSTGRDVAVKVLLQENISNESAIKRFRQEAITLSNLKHPNIVQVYRYDLMSDGTPYIVMEVLSGRTLDKLIRESGPLAPSAIKSIFVPLLTALEYAHSQGVIHRDVKPSNIVIEEYLPEGSGKAYSVKLVDFGIAHNYSATDQKLTQTGALIGSPAYMSPEQCAGATVDERSDLYSVGVVLYEALVGGPLFPCEAQLDLLYKQVHEMPASPSTRVAPYAISRKFDELVLKALSKAPNSRFNSARDMKSELEKILSVQAIDAPAGAKKGPGWLLAGSAAIIALCAFLSLPTNLTQVQPTALKATPSLFKAWKEVSADEIRKNLTIRSLDGVVDAIARDPKATDSDRFDLGVKLICYYRAMREYSKAKLATAVVKEKLSDAPLTSAQRVELDAYQSEFAVRSIPYDSTVQRTVARAQLGRVQRLLEGLKKKGDEFTIKEHYARMVLCNVACDIAETGGKHDLALKFKESSISHAENLWNQSYGEMLLAYMDKAKLMFLCGRTAEAKRIAPEVEKLVSLTDQRYQRRIYLRLAALHYLLGETVKANEDISTCLRLCLVKDKPFRDERIAICRQAAIIKLRLKEYAEAASLIEEALKSSHEVDDSSLADTSFVAGELALAQGNKQKAKKYFDDASQILRSHPLWNDDRTPFLYWRLAQLDREAGRIDSAVQSFNKSADAWPILWFRDGDYEKMLAEFEQMLTQDNRQEEAKVIADRLKEWQRAQAAQKR